MQKLIFISAFAAFLSCNVGGKSTDRSFVAYSQFVKDSFEIYVNLPDNYRTENSYDVFYYMDANLKSGKKLQQFLRDSVLSRNSCHSIYVGIGHIGNYRDRRRRDFIVPKIENGDTINSAEDFGQVDNFYNFLKHELIPEIQQRYSTGNDNNSIFGHSFGGLFAIYCLFKNDELFRNFYSLSPSLWINDYAIYSFNHLPDTSGIGRNVFLSTGSEETLNRIKTGTDEFDKFIKEKKYPYLAFKYVVYDGETHNSQVPYSIRDIFKAKE